MAIQWGPANGSLRLGVEFTRTAQTATAETWRCDAYIQTTTAVWDATNTYTVSGAFSGTGTADISSSETRTKFFSQSKTFTKQYGKAVAQSVSVSITGINAGNVPAMSASFTVAARAYSAPNAPTGVSASRTTETQARVTWSATATTGAPISGFSIGMQTNGGAWNYRTVSASTRSWVANLPPNNKYRFSVRAQGAGGNSVYVNTGEVFTKPATPATPTVERAVGNNVVVRWTNRANPAMNYQTQIYEGSTLLGTVAARVATFTVTGVDPSTPHTYRVRHIAGGFPGEFANTNRIALITPPNAPTGLTPAGVWVATGQPVELRWEHASVDGSAQTAATVQVAVNGGAYATIADVTGPTNTATFTPPAGTSVFDWQVRTKGDHAEFSPYSDPAKVYTEAPPTTTLAVTLTDGVINSNQATVRVSSTAPTPYRYTLTVTDPDGTPVYTGDAQSAGASVTVVVPGLANDTDYTFTAVTYSRVPSEPVTVTHMVNYEAPPVPTLETEWDPETGVTTLAMFAGAGAVATTSMELYRDVGAGSELVADFLASGDTVTDVEGHPAGVTTYRLIAHSALGATATRTVTVDTTGAPLNGAQVTTPDGTLTALLSWAFHYAGAHTLAERELVDMDGATLPVIFAGVHRRNTGTVSGRVFVQETPATLPALEALAVFGGPVLYRDGDGRRLWASMSGLDTRRALGGRAYDVSFNLTEVAKL